MSATELNLPDHLDLIASAPEGIKKLRSLILELAVRGKLAPQDPNDEPASELLKRIEAEKTKLIAAGKLKRDKPLPPIDQSEITVTVPSDWSWIRMQSGFDVRDGTHDTPKYVEKDGVPLITSKNFVVGAISFDDAKLISTIDHESIKKRSGVTKGDIIYSMIGGNIGNQVFVDTDREFSIKNVALFKYYSIKDSSPQFLNIFLKTVTFRIQAQAAGGAQPFVSLSFLRNVPMPLPPLAEQHRIVAKVDELIVLCDSLKAKVGAGRTAQARLATALIETALEAA